MIPRLHLVTDDRVVGDPRFRERAREAVEAGRGGVALHLRGPTTSGRDLWSLGRDLALPIRSEGATFLLNDRIDVAIVVGADGVHLGARGFPVGIARSLLGEGALVGRSMHGGMEAAALREEGLPDFVLAGTIYATSSHPGRDGVGPSGIREVARALPDVPILGIGGITSPRVREVIAAGAHGVAVLGAVWDAAERPGRAVERLLEQLEAATVAAGPRPSNG